MKRDMDLARELTLRIESMVPPAGLFDPFLNLDPSEHAMKFDGFTVAEVHYHLHLLAEAGFLDGVKELRGSTCVMVKGLTWKGHDFVDSVRDPEIWRETKDGAKKVGGFSLELLVALAKGLIKKKIEEHTGVELDL